MRRSTPELAARSRSAFAVLAALSLLGALPIFGSACAAANQKPRQADTSNEAEGDGTDQQGSAAGTPTATVDTTPEPQTALATLLYGGTGGGADQQKLYEQIASAPAAKADPAGSAGTDANAKKIRELAKQFAPGMNPDGPLYRATLKENERVQVELTLKTGTCYAIVGYGDKVADLDLHLMLPPGVMSSQDTTDDKAPIIGRAPDPFCPSTQMTYKLDVFAEHGGGDVAVLVYSKPR